jgi:hypothetical protein
MRISRAIVAASLLALSCTAHAPFRSAPGAIETSSRKLAEPNERKEAARHSVELHPNFILAFVEFDDQGRFWDRRQLEELDRTLDREARAANGDVIVAVFAHGWKHDSAVCDESVACFRAFLAQLARDSEALTRLSAGRLAPRRIVGVYAGWRGRSVTVRVLRELTFWARKSAALRIGGGDLIELLTRIDGFVKRANADGADHAHMVTMGHSFGGTMVYTALANILKARLVEALGRQGNPDPRATVVNGFGDIVVLVNPAFEASLYLTLHDLSDSLKELSPLQGPALITIESETDRPNRTWFPLGQRLATLFNRAANRAERVSLRTAVGNYERFWDYRLAAAPGEKASHRGSSDMFGVSRGPCSCDLELETTDEEFGRLLSILEPQQPDRTLDSGRSALPSGTVRYGRTELTCLKPHDRRSPFWVVRATDEVVHEHSGIFTSYLMDFIRHVMLEAMEREGRIGRSGS